MASYQGTADTIQEARAWLNQHLSIDGAHWIRNENSYELYA